MSSLRSILFLAAMAVASNLVQTGVLQAEEPKLSGTWKMSLDTPHGQMPGALQLKQEGAKLTGSVDVEHMGSMPLTGEVENGKISFSIEVQAGQKVTFSGTVTGDKMSGSMDHGGTWTAARGDTQI